VPTLTPAMMAAMGRGSMPPAGAGTSPGQPPFGSSPMTPPVPMRGLEGKGATLVAQAKRLLEQAISEPGLGAETEIGQAILKSLEAIGKVMPEGAVSPGMERAGMQQFLLGQRQTNPMMSIMAALGQGGGAQPPGQPAQPPAAPPGM